MILENCRFITTQDRAIAEKWKINPHLFSTLCSLFIQDKKANEEEIPADGSSAFYDGVLRKYKEYEDKQDELELAFPFYKVDPDMVPLIQVTSNEDPIAVKTINNSNFSNIKEELIKKIDSSKEQLIEDIKKEIDNPHLCYSFLLWYGLGLKQEGKKTSFFGVYDTSLIEESLRKVKKYKGTRAYAQRRQNVENYNGTLEYVSNGVQLCKDEILLKRMGAINEHIDFNPDGHIYTIDGKQADFSVSEYAGAKKSGLSLKELAEKKEKGETSEKGKYFDVSTALGDTYDDILRDYFLEKVKDSYANANAEDIQKIKEIGSNIKDALHKKHGNNIRIITQEDILRLCATVKENGNEFLIAGSMDMLVVDEKGDMYVYDFKTKRKSDNSSGDFTESDKKKYFNQITGYKDILETLFPDFKGKIHVGGLLKINIFYKEPIGLDKNNVKSGEVEYISEKNEDGTRQIYVQNEDGSRTPIQNATITKLKFKERVYSPGHFDGIISPISSVNDETPAYGIPDSIKSLIPSTSNISNTTPESKAIVFKKSGQATKSQINNIKNGTQKQITKLTKPDYWSDVKKGDIIKLHSDTEVIYVEVTSDAKEIKLNEVSSEQWKKDNADNAYGAQWDNVRKTLDEKKPVYSFDIKFVAVDNKESNQLLAEKKKREEEYNKPANSIKDLEISFNALNNGSSWATAFINHKIKVGKAANGGTVEDSTIYGIAKQLNKKKETIPTYRDQIASYIKAVEKADAVFAIANIGDSGWVQDNIAFGCQRGINRNIPVYVFNQMDNQWYTWNKDKKQYVKYDQTPILSRHAACLQLDKEVSEASKEAIQDVIKATKESFKEQKQDKPENLSEQEKLQQKKQNVETQINNLQSDIANSDTKGLSEKLVESLTSALATLAEAQNQNKILMEELLKMKSADSQQSSETNNQPQNQQKEDKKDAASNLTSLLKKPENIATKKPDDNLESAPKVDDAFIYDYVSLSSNTRLEELYRELDPQHFEYRKSFIANLFYSYATRELDSLTESIQSDRDTAEAKGDSAMALAFSQRLNVLQDDFVQGIQYIIQAKGAKYFADKIYQHVSKQAERAKSEDLKKQWGIVKEYFPILFNASSALIEKLCYVNISLTDNHSVLPTRSEQDVDSPEPSTSEEDLAGETVSGNDGWNFKIKFVNPHTTISSTTKKILRQCPQIDRVTGKPKKDDLGNTVYLDETVAHNTLISETCKIKNVDEFCQKVVLDDGTETYKFPLFEKIASKYPFVRHVIKRLTDETSGNVSQKVSAFYHDLRQEFKKYVSILGDEKIVLLNLSAQEETVLLEITRNFANGVTLHTNSIYDKQSRYVGENILTGCNKIKNMKSFLYKRNSNNYKEAEEIEGSTYYKEGTVFQDIADLCKMIGLNTSSSEIKDICNSFEDFRDAFKEIFDVLNNIYDTALRKSVVNKKYHSIKDYDFTVKEASTIKKLGGIISFVRDDSRMATFRQGKQQFASYTAPSFYDKIIKGITSKGKARKDFFEKNYKQFNHFFEKEKGWKGSTTEAAFESYIKLPCLLEALEDNIDGIRDKFDFVEILFANSLPFEEWGPEQLMQNEWKMYSDSDLAKSNENLARYNCPIHADSNHAIYITGQKFHDTIREDEQWFIEDKISSLLAMQAIKEIERIDLVQKMNEGVKEGKYYPIEYFNGKQGLSFCLFPFMNERKEEIIAEYKRKETKQEQKRYLKEIIKEHYVSEFKKYSSVARPLYRELINANRISNTGNTYTKERAQFEIESRFGKDQLVISGVNEEEAKKLKDERIQEEELISDEAELREYYFNRIYMQSQLIELTTVDLAFYKNLENFQKRFKQVVASGYRPNTNSKYGRKIQRSLYVEDPSVVSNTIKEVEDILETAYSEGRMTENEKSRIMHEMSNITPTDGQCFRSFKSYRSVLDMIGMWGDKEETAYQNIINNRWSYADLDVVFRILKSFQFTFTTTEVEGVKIHVPTQFKCSEFPLLACYQLIGGPTKTHKLMGLSKFMEDNDIDCAYFHSGIKEGCYGQVNLDDESDKFGHSEKTGPDYYEQLKKLCIMKDGSFNPNIVHETEYEDFMIAMPTPPHGIDAETNLGSQMKTIIENMLPDKNPDGTDYTITLKGQSKPLTKAEFKQLYDDVYKSKMYDGYKEVVGIFSDIHKVQKYLIKQIKDNPKYGPEMLEALQIVDVQYQDPVTGAMITKQDFNIPIGYPSIRKQIEDILLSAFKNHVTKLKTRGAANILVADWENKLQVKYKQNKLTGKHSIDYVECCMPWHTKKQLSKFLVKKTTTSHGVTKEYYEIDFKKIEREAPDLLEGLGYRIPTEASYSILPLRIVGFLPQQYGSAIMLPSDITKISGSDFDIDKLFILLKHFNIDPNTGKISAVSYDLRDGIDSFTPEQRDNLYIDLCLAAMKADGVVEKWIAGGNFDKLKRNSRTMEIAETPYLFEKYALEKGISKEEFDEFMDIKNKGTLPNKHIIDKMYGILEQLYHEDLKYVEKFIDENKKPLDPLSPVTYMRFHLLNAVANKLIGYYAISDMGHYKMKDAQAIIEGLPKMIIDGVKIGNIDHDSPFGEDIAENQAQFIDASVDAVKDNAIAGLNQNSLTAPITNTLVRLGLPLEIVSVLLKHPAFDIRAFKKNSRNTVFSPKQVLSLNTAELMADIVLGRKKSESAVKYQQFMTAIYALNEGLTSITQVNRAETPTGACPTSVAKLITKIINCYITTQALQQKRYPIKMKDGFVCAPGKVSDYNDIRNVKEDIKNFTLQQAGYSLGIESALTLLGQHIDYLNKDVLQVLYNIVNGKGRPLTEDMVEMFLNEFNKFLLSGADIMQDDQYKTFYEKREYYTEEFPKFFVEHKDLVKDLAMNFIYWDEKHQDLRLSSNAGKSKAFHNRLSMEFESFLMSDDPIKQKMAIGLYMYCVYEDKLRFGPNNFGQQFTSRFVAHLPSLVNRSRVLRTILHNKEFFTSEDNMSMTNFLSQFYTYHWQIFLKTIKKDKSMFFSTDANGQKVVRVPMDLVKSEIDGNPVEAFCLETKRTDGSTLEERFVRIEAGNEFSTYVKIEMPDVTSSKTVYNCSDTIENILEKCPDLTGKKKKKEEKEEKDSKQKTQDTTHDVSQSDIGTEETSGYTEEDPSSLQADVNQVYEGDISEEDAMGVSASEIGSVSDLDASLEGTNVDNSDIASGNIFQVSQEDLGLTGEEDADNLQKNANWIGGNPKGYGKNNKTPFCSRNK